MAKTFQCSLVTPQREVLDEAVVYASIPAHDGQMGVMDQRAPLVVKLGDGALRLDGDGGSPRWYFVGGGFAQMKDNRLSLVADEAVTVGEIDRGEVEAELKEAQARVAHGEEEQAAKLRRIKRAKTKLGLLGR